MENYIMVECALYVYLAWMLKSKIHSVGRGEDRPVLSGSGNDIVLLIAADKKENDSLPTHESSIVEALPVDEDLDEVSSEKEEADAVVAEPVSEENGAKGWALRHTRVVAILLVLIVAAIVAFTMVSSKTLLISSVLVDRTGFAMRHRSF
jgi:hypothetical protein